MQRNRLELLIFEDLLTRIFSFSFRETETKERVREKKKWLRGRKEIICLREEEEEGSGMADSDNTRSRGGVIPPIGKWITLMNVSILFVQPVFRFIVHDEGSRRRNLMGPHWNVTRWTTGATSATFYSRESRPSVYFIFQSGQVRSDFGLEIGPILKRSTFSLRPTTFLRNLSTVSSKNLSIIVHYQNQTIPILEYKVFEEIGEGMGYIHTR